MNAYKFEDCKVGMKETFTVCMSEEKFLTFQALTGDDNPLHSDKEFAKEHGYAGKVSYGMLTASFLSTLAGVYLPGKYSLIRTVEVHFSKAVFFEDRLTVTGEVSDINETLKLVDIKVRIYNGEGAAVLRGKMRVGFLDE